MASFLRRKHTHNRKNDSLLGSVRECVLTLSTRLSVYTMAAPSCFAPICLQKTIGDGGGNSIELLFLGCEDKPPYGPYLHTANLFVDLICRALESCETKTTNVALKVYSVSQGNFPTSKDFETCDGVILPGSFNSAYDNDPWILQLKEVIQTELVANRRKTLGICFGHQLYAHSFEKGEAVKCGAGPQSGRKTSQLTSAGLKWLNKSADNLDLYYTHGDMVERLPPQGIRLGGNSKVPIQAAVYFHQEPIDENENNEPIAVTLQAHPEFASSRGVGLEQTLLNIMHVMEKTGGITVDDRKMAEDDAIKNFDSVESASIQVMIATGKALGWF